MLGLPLCLTRVAQLPESEGLLPAWQKFHQVSAIIHSCVVASET